MARSFRRHGMFYFFEHNFDPKCSNLADILVQIYPLRGAIYRHTNARVLYLRPITPYLVKI
jgi:hypothetical protein